MWFWKKKKMTAFRKWQHRVFLYYYYYSFLSIDGQETYVFSFIFFLFILNLSQIILPINLRLSNRYRKKEKETKHWDKNWNDYHVSNWQERNIFILYRSRMIYFGYKFTFSRQISERKKKKRDGIEKKGHWHKNRN